MGYIRFGSLAVLLVVYFNSINSAPPDERTPPYMALTGRFSAWAYWIDRTRLWRDVVEDSHK